MVVRYQTSDLNAAAGDPAAKAAQAAEEEILQILLSVLLS